MPFHRFPLSYYRCPSHGQTPKIFEDNLNWAAFHPAEKDNLCDVELNEGE